MQTRSMMAHTVWTHPQSGRSASGFDLARPVPSLSEHELARYAARQRAIRRRSVFCDQRILDHDSVPTRETPIRASRLVAVLWPPLPASVSALLRRARCQVVLVLGLGFFSQANQTLFYREAFRLFVLLFGCRPCG